MLNDFTFGLASLLSQLKANFRNIDQKHHP